jgi:hypothetical protein
VRAADATAVQLYQIQSSVLMLSGYATGKKVYKVSRMTETPNSLTTTPCGVCPVRKQVRIAFSRGSHKTGHILQELI